jgi:hypothetical protein
MRFHRKASASRGGLAECYCSWMHITHRRWLTSLGRAIDHSAAGITLNLACAERRSGAAGGAAPHVLLCAAASRSCLARL